MTNFKIEVANICPGCGNEIDWDMCWCGISYDDHYFDGHYFVPMGCDCGRVESEKQND